MITLEQWSAEHPGWNLRKKKRTTRSLAAIKKAAKVAARRAKRRAVSGGLPGSGKR